MQSRATKTQTVSYRIDMSVLEEMIREAASREISVNVLVNMVLRRFIEFDRYQQHLGLLPVPKQLVMDMINYRDDVEIKLLAQEAFRILKDAVIFTQKREDLEAFLLVLQEYMKIAGIVSDHTINGSKHTFAIQHGMGLKWSEFTKELLTIIFEKLARRRLDFTLTESSVLATTEL